MELTMGIAVGSSIQIAAGERLLLFARRRLIFNAADDPSDS
jgi:hypothetical protein